ncbi:uncharacterized protein LOC135687241 [Rhopilema esculentum]|uniref:uncharacterized protein LOC135687241 n=1 Tax=Rhopilema esculentum TaxID=499914 RepID=UPI0031E0C086
MVLYILHYRTDILRYFYMKRVFEPCVYPMGPDSKSPRPQRTPGVLFFNHFPKNFLRPYGRAEGMPSKEKTLSRLQPEGCEWLRRPHVAVSELAATMQGNTDLLKEKADFFTTESLASFFKNIQPFVTQLTPFNKDSPMNPSENQCRDLLKTMLSTSAQLDKQLDTALEVGSALFILAIQFKVAQVLISNPVDYANKMTLHPNPEPAFKYSNNLLHLIPLLRQYSSISQPTPPVSSLIETLLDELSSSSSSSPSSTITKPKKSKKKKKKRSYSPEPEEEPPKKKKKSKKKKESKEKKE